MRSNALKIKKIIVVRMFIKIYTKVLQILIEFYNLYGFIFSWLPTTLLIMKKKLWFFSFLLFLYKLSHRKYFLGQKFIFFVKSFFKKIIFLINVMLTYVVIFQINNVFKRFHATQTFLHFYSKF